MATKQVERKIKSHGKKHTGYNTASAAQILKIDSQTADRNNVAVKILCMLYANSGKVKCESE